MKRFKCIFRVSLLFIFISLTCRSAYAQVDSTILKSMDSVCISLLTCGPGNQIYSLYGHTAIRFQDFKRGQDIVINYGMFSFQQDYFILRFVFGLTDYEMGIVPFSDFITEYSQEGRWIKQQTVNLTKEEKWAIAQAIDENYRPENRTYRYNYFFDNCTTRARDMIVNHINGTILYNGPTATSCSFRSMIHQWNSDYPWARLGNDMLLGVKADFKTSKTEQQFLPDSLRKDFDSAIIINHDGSRRVLVTQTLWLLHPSASSVSKSFFLSPLQLAFILLFVTLLVILIEKRENIICWGYDLFLMTISGLAGIILFAMIFSKHPTVSLNTQIMIFNPITLFFVYQTIKHLRQRRIHNYLYFGAIMIVLFLALYPIQHYDFAIGIVALILLIRIWSLRLLCKKNTHKYE